MAVRSSVLMALALALVRVSPVSAQNPSPLCVTGCGGGGSALVYVTPDGQGIQAVSGAATTVPYIVHNIGTVSDTYTLTCSVINGHETCGAVSPSTLTLAPESTATVNVTFTPGSTGTSGTVQLEAAGRYCNGGGAQAQTHRPSEMPEFYCTYATDSGTYNVTNVAGLPPVISLVPQNSGLRVADAFDELFVHTTPEFSDLGSSHYVSLIYNSSTVRPTPVVQVDVTDSGPTTATAYGLQVRLLSSGANLHLMNGSDTVFYVAHQTVQSRLAAAIDAKANGLKTGWYDVTVIVTAYYAPGPIAASTTTRFFVEDESGSQVGSGWLIGGVQRLYTQAGSYSALIANGDGTLSFFRRDCSTCAFVSPAGDPTILYMTSDPSKGTIYRRATLDSSYVDFTSDGRMWRSWEDRVGFTTWTIGWTDTLITSLKDKLGFTHTLSYSGSASQSNKLQTITDPGGRVTTSWTDAAGQVYKITDPDGLSTNLAYDGKVRLRTVTDRAGNASDIRYDTLSRVDSTLGPSFTDYTGSVVRSTVRSTSPDALVWQASVTGTTQAAAKGSIRSDTLMATVVDPSGFATRFAINRFGNVTKSIDPLGNVSTATVDTLGQTLRTVSPLGHVVTNTYSGYLLTQVHDSNTTQTINYDYDPTSNLLVTIRGDVTRMDYYYMGLHIFGLLNGPLDSVYVGNTGTYAAPSGGYIAQWYYYNRWYQVDSLVDALGHGIGTSYSDSAHGSNPDSIRDALGRIVSRTHYDSFGRPDTAYTLSVGGYASTAFAYDAMNRDTLLVNPMGYRIRTAYGPLTPTRLTDPKRQVYRTDYNQAAAMTVIHDLADTTKGDSLKYDVEGNLRSIRTRRGDLVTMTYDALGRPLTRSGPDFPADTFRYDPAGRWAVAKNATAYDSTTLDALGRVSSVTQRFGMDTTTYTMNYAYDVQGRLVSRSAPQGGHDRKINYYRPIDQSTQVLTMGERVSIFGNADGVRIGSGFQDSATNATWGISDSVNAVHQMVNDSFYTFFTNGVTRALDTAFAHSWTNDSVNRLTSELPYGTSPFGGRRYRYDLGGELLNACDDHSVIWQPSCTDEYGEETSGGTNAYAYDSAGNRVDPQASAIIGAGNRVTRFKGYAIAYDANGNVISRKGSGGAWSGDTTLFTWDAQGDLTRAETWNPGQSHTVVTYGYDALGRRVSRTVNGVTERYVYDGNQVIMDIDSASRTVKAEYGWGPDGNLAYVRTTAWLGGLVNDMRAGSIRGVVGVTTGLRIKQYPVTTAWGETVADTGLLVRFRMADAEYDQETGLYHMGARYYDPKLGRFLSEDPSGLAGGLNLYTYAGNDPIDNIDPTGLDDCKGHSSQPTPPGGITVTAECPPDNPNPPPDDPEADWATAMQGYCVALGTITEPNCGDLDTFDPPFDFPEPPDPPKLTPVIANVGPSCRDAKLLLAASAATDVLFFATGGLDGVINLGRAGLYGAESLLRVGTKMAPVYARGALEYGASKVASAYVGKLGYGVVVTGAVNGTGAVVGGGFHWSDLWNFVPLVGTYKAWQTERKACAKGA